MMSTPEQRMKMAKAIVDFEARRDKKGRLQVYKLPAGDGGGRYEVAGINERFNKEVCDHLVDLIEAGEYDKAEALATEFIASDTDIVVTWSAIAAIESYLRDSVFNRGHGGGAKILQIALGMEADGVIGPRTRAVIEVAEQNPVQLLLDLRAARERYEREVVKRNERSKFWKGLVNRWDGALKFAIPACRPRPGPSLGCGASALRRHLRSRESCIADQRRPDGDRRSRSAVASASPRRAWLHGEGLAALPPRRRLRSW
jgi:hypothetical protein